MMEINQSLSSKPHLEKGVKKDKIKLYQEKALPKK